MKIMDKFLYAFDIDVYKVNFWGKRKLYYRFSRFILTNTENEKDIKDLIFKRNEHFLKDKDYEIKIMPHNYFL